ncbi:aminopeptidase [Halobacterium zhouii]|uniref:aminopeptidase n=1 Tax=Halobacterium zhouii TaxID=2902624 RepID=UPI001E3868B0|nr:aminopeptidase [Halobacterium zhouii]
MDPRVRQHAEVIVEHSTEIEEGDHVVINAPSEAEELVTALYRLCGERDAKPVWVGTNPRASRELLQHSDPEKFSVPEHVKGLYEGMDVYIGVRSATNVNEMGDLSPDIMAEYGKAQKEVQEIRLGKRWCGTQYPSQGYAQKAEMSTAAYEEFVYDAVNKDWAAQREFQAQMVEILDPAEEVRIVSGDTTDITMSVAGMNTVNDDGKTNLPGGEVFTAPVPDSVEGEVLFDKPVMTRGREVQNASLEFEDGVVVDYDADQHADVLAAVLDTDEGARRLGELGIGMNRDIDEFTYNMLFDEKMGDTIHLAIGKAIDETVPEGQPKNESATHLDMIVDMAEDSYIEVDGEVVQRDGTFRFEDGFEE